MKSFIFFLFTVSVWAQTATPLAPPAPASKPLPPETVVATFEDGKKLTAGELEAFLNAMPPNMQAAARRDRRGFVKQFAMMHRLSEMAEKNKLDQASPTREALSFNRMYLLMNAQLHDVLGAITVPQTEIDTYYKANAGKYKQVKVKAIYAAFSADGGKDSKHLTEAQALTKIGNLRTAIAGGGNFAALAKANSDDATSAAKDGDFGTIRSTDNLPDAIRTAIFALNPGELSQPVKQPNGFYLFRAEEVTPQPEAEVQEEIVTQLKQAHFKSWMDNISNSLNYKVLDEGFFNQAEAGAPASGK